MKTADFIYDLPDELIAQSPAEPRDHARMLVYDRSTGETAHRHFYDLTDYLRAGDVLVMNNTKVLPARLYGVKANGGRAEFLLLKRLNLTDWETVCRPAKRAKTGTEFRFNDALSLTVIGEGEEGKRLVRFAFTGVFEDILADTGEMPLPHYIKKMPDNPERYQTVYAKHDGSSAAPTAGLHFTPALLDALKDKGVIPVEVLLHVGLGTFRPVKVEDVTQHKMHSEYYEISPEAAAAVNLARAENRRVIAVGTTSVRVLESSFKDGAVRPGSGETDIFIYPPYRFKAVDALITNFHLPGSTLLMLVSAFMGQDNALNLYRGAVEQQYRFFSFGDATLIL